MNKKFFTFAAVMLVALLGLIEPALAQTPPAASASVMGVAASKALDAFAATRTIVFIVGGFGLVGIACAAIFGKMNWKWFAFLAVGLAILAAAGSIVEYATTTGGAASTSYITRTQNHWNVDSSYTNDTLR